MSPLGPTHLMGAGEKGTPQRESRRSLWGWDNTGFDEKLQSTRKKGKELETPERRVREKEMGHRSQPQQSQSGDWGIQGNQGNRVVQFPAEQEMQIISL